MPEVAHAFHTFAVRITADGCCIRYQSHIEALSSVERFQDDRCSALQRKLSQFVKLFTQIVACVHRVRLAWILPIESRHHDHATGTYLSCCFHYFTHGGVKLLLLFVFSQYESTESGTDSTCLDVSSLESFVDLFNS